MSYYTSVNDDLNLDDVVSWTSQSAGVVKTKVGKIVEVVPRGSLPTKMNPQKLGMIRRHQSYVVRANDANALTGSRSRLYWPRVGRLELIAITAGETPQEEA